MPAQRERQLAYSELQDKMLDETGRRTKSAKICAVLEHFLGTNDFSGLTAVDVGCSVGFTVEALHQRGATAIGVDIDVPGLAKARQRHGSEMHFVCTDSEALPWPDESLDLIVFNHIYEHVVDADKAMAELRRVLKPDGVMYLGLGNRLGVVEPHYKLPFLSWLPHGGVADAYVRTMKRADHYHEQFRTRPGLRKMVAGLNVFDYSLSVILDAQAFHATDQVPGFATKVPRPVIEAASILLPTYIWVATKSGRRPAGPALQSAPVPVRA